jgi:hypothetical protein
MNSSDFFEILAGLPGEGPMSLSFSATGQGRHREGFVVKFMPINGASWVGNFQPGLTKFNSVFEQEGGNTHLVISGGQAYVVRTATGELLAEFGGSIEFAQTVGDDGKLLISNGISFSLCKSAKTIWQTRRLSWDGIRNIELTNASLKGEGWCFDETWHPFEVNLEDGKSVGGGYTGPDSYILLGFRYRSIADAR